MEADASWLRHLPSFGGQTWMLLGTHYRKLFSVVTLLQFISSDLRHSSSLRLFLLSLLTNTLPGPSTSEVTTLWRYANLFIIIIIITLCV